MDANGTEVKGTRTSAQLPQTARKKKKHTHYTLRTHRANAKLSPWLAVDGDTSQVKVESVENRNSMEMDERRRSGSSKKGSLKACFFCFSGFREVFTALWRVTRISERSQLACVAVGWLVE